MIAHAHREPSSDPVESCCRVCLQTEPGSPKEKFSPGIVCSGSRWRFLPHILSGILPAFWPLENSAQSFAVEGSTGTQKE